MSQFLICKSEHNLSKYGIRLQDTSSNIDLYYKVINQYVPKEDVNNIWVIDKIHNMINQLQNNLHEIQEIASKSEWMIFWYGSDFDELDVISSEQELMGYLKRNITNPCLEIYLYVSLYKNDD